MQIVKYTNPVVSYDKVINKRKRSLIHYHNEHELYYLICGKTKYFVGDEIFHLKQGNFIFIPKGTIHKTDSEECLHNERLLIGFDDDIFDKDALIILKEFTKNKLIIIPKNDQSQAEEILHRLLDESRGDQVLKDYLIKLYTLELVTLLYRCKSDQKQEPKVSDKIIFEISEYINLNFEQDISLDNLCERFSISKSHLSRKFKTVAGIGLNEYITFVRISNAEKLLKNSNYSITQIAAMCGFNDSNYFSTVFKRLKGITPLKYSKS